MPVGGGGHHYQVAGIQMALDQPDRGRRNSRHDLGHQEFFPQRFTLQRRAAGQRADVEVRELLRAHGRIAVAARHLLVARLERIPRQHPLGHQELAPQLVAVARQQRVVEVEQRQTLTGQGCRRCHALGRVKVWMPYVDSVRPTPESP